MLTLVSALTVASQRFEGFLLLDARPYRQEGGARSKLMLSFRVNHKKLVGTELRA